jgi:hypothetical protein
MRMTRAIVASIVLLAVAVGHSPAGSMVIDPVPTWTYDGTLTLLGSTLITGATLNQPGGLAFDGSSLWLGNISYPMSPGMGYQTLLRINPATGVVQETDTLSYMPTPTGPTGLAFSPASGGQMLLTNLGDYTPNIQEVARPTDIMGTLNLQGAQGALRARGLESDGRFVWEAYYSPTAGHLYAMDPVSGARVNDLVVDPYANGLTTDGRSLLVSHDLGETGGSYVAMYDRSGTVLGRFGLPTALAGKTLGDLAYANGTLYALSAADSTVYRFAIPQRSSPPLPVAGQLGYKEVTEAQMTNGAQVQSDFDAANDTSALPIGTSFRRSTYSADQLSKARVWTDSANKTHRLVHALTYLSMGGSNMSDSASFTMDKTILLTPAMAGGLASGTPILAGGTLTLTGQLVLINNFGGSQGSGTTASINVTIFTPTGSTEKQIFDGGISITGLGAHGDKTAAYSLSGSLATAGVLSAVEAGFTVGSNMAVLSLNGLVVPYSIPCNVGKQFDVFVTMTANTSVPDYMYGVGAEAVFGESALLAPGYTVPQDIPSYGDFVDTSHVYVVTAPMPIPEPASLLLLSGALVALRRRRR